MQANTFSRLVIATMALAVILPGMVWLIDSLSEQSGWFAHILGSLALLTIPVFWVIGNIITGITALYNRALITKLFWLQCVVSVLILLATLYWFATKKFESHENDLRNNVLQAIITRDISKYKQALTRCGDACLSQYTVASVTNSKAQYDEYVYKDWLATAVAAQALQIVDDLLIDRNRPNIPLVGSGAPYLSLDDACSGYYVGNADVFQLAVLQKTPVMLQRLIANASIDDKSTALWYAAQANRIDYVEILLAAGANRKIKDGYGVDGVEQAGYSLLDAAVAGFAVETLQWLLNNGFAPNGQLGKTPLGADETATLKHTPLHSVVYMAHQEQTQFNSLERSIKMWQILKKAGADDTIAKAQSYRAPQTPLQYLLQSNVYEGSAEVVKAFVAQNISSIGLTEKEQAKLAEFKALNVVRDKDYNGQLQPEYCAEKRLKDNYEAN